MALVTAVTLTMSNYELSDDYEANDLPICPPLLFEEINRWLRDHGEAELHLLGNRAEPSPAGDRFADRSDGFGGCVRPYLQIASGGYRDIFDLDSAREKEFRDFVLRLPWRYPEVVTLTMTHDGDPSVVYRPDYE